MAVATSFGFPFQQQHRLEAEGKIWSDIERLVCLCRTLKGVVVSQYRELTRLCLMTRHLNVTPS